NNKQIYLVSDKKGKPDLSRYVNQYQVRTNELNAMLNYCQMKVDCLMKNLRHHLGDLDAQICNHCNVCALHNFKLKEDPLLISSISEWLASRVVKISPSKVHAISAGFSILDGTLRSKIFIQFMTERAQANSEEKGISQELFALIKKQLENLRKQHLSC